jgi:hypothetical protein
MNSRSPRVVSIARMPRRRPPPGTQISQTVMPTSRQAIAEKNAAVSNVQAIHERPMVQSLFHTRPSAKPLAM